MTELINNDAAVNAIASPPEPASGAGLDPGPTGTLLYPGDDDWDKARAAWVINVDQRPAAVALVRSVEDVSAVVTSAGRNRLKVMAGHRAWSYSGRPPQPHSTGTYCRVERSSRQPG
jgi:hypothetical protein